MPSSSPRDSFAFPLAAALWAVAGSLATSAVNVAMTLGRFVGDGAMPEVLCDLLPGLVGQSLLTVSLVAVLVFVVAERRQARAPERVGHARGAAATTGLLAAAGAWTTVSLASALAYSQIDVLQSPKGFAAVGVALSLLHLGTAALGASVGAALLPQAGEAPVTASSSRQAWVGAAVFGAVLAFGIDLVVAALPGLLHDALGTEVFATGRWSPLLALLVAAVSALGYAWRRHRPSSTLAWSGDVWAAFACLPATLLLGAVFGVLAAVLAYLGSGNEPQVRVVIGFVLLLVAGLALGGLGALAGLLRTRVSARAG